MTIVELTFATLLPGHSSSFPYRSEKFPFPPTFFLCLTEFRLVKKSISVVVISLGLFFHGPTEHYYLLRIPMNLVVARGVLVRCYEWSLNALIWVVVKKVSVGNLSWSVAVLSYFV